ncbi:hypothetical protein [Baekduia alba]|uniref:hypothetical protein n=1 Tax=Baekduia alba TaxID=2997333 RepID=UPI0023420466|nr:hypothetical protein [Baekduia alba]
MANARSQLLAAIHKYGPSVDAIAAQYTNPVTGGHLSGEGLLAKLLQGESSALSDPDAAGGKVSGAGAKAWGQFMPGSRQEAIRKFGLDPWASIDQAVHATELHLRGKINGSTGLEGYNPGDPTYAGYILGQKVGSLKGAPSSRQATTEAAYPEAAPVSSVATSDVPDLAGLLAQSQAASKPEGPASAGVAAPSFSAAPALPQGYQQAQGSGGGGSQGADLSSLLRGVAAMEPALTTQTSQTTSAPDSTGTTAETGSQASPSASTARSGGKVVVGEAAERAGHGLQKPILSFLHELSSRSGRTVEVTTGTNHNRMTTSGNVSDHWDGNAADLGVGGDARQDGAAGKKGDLIAAHALQVAYGEAGKKVSFADAYAQARKGGLWNIETPKGRVQIIWRSLVGGNHYNHVHTGLNPGR